MLALGVVLAGVVFCYPLSLDIPLLDPDEGLHASIAQEMVEKGDWLSPRFRGEPFLDKPILFFWAEALSLRLFGMHEAAVRLPGLMLGLLGAVTTGFVGWRMFGRRVGLLAGLLYATMILPVALAQAAVHDVALIPCVNMALLLFWESDRASRWRSELKYALAIGLFLGLACLAKGLAGVTLVGVAYGCYLLLRGRLTVAACLRGAAALTIAALIASLWYVPAELRNPGYLSYYFVERHLLGYATGTQRHGAAPWWYYLPVLLGGGLPWIAYLPVVVQETWIRRSARLGRGGQSHFRCAKIGTVPGAEIGTGPKMFPEGAGSNGAMLLLWCWLIGCTLFLSLAHSKLITYIWPVFPAVAILAGVAWARLLEGVLSEPARRSILLTFWLSSLGGVALPPVAMLVAQSKFTVQFGWPVWTATVLVTLGAWIPLGFLWAGRLRATLSAGILSVAAQYVVMMTVVVPAVAATTSARELARHFNRLGRVPPRVVIIEERLGSLVVYLEPELRAGLKAGQLRYAVRGL
ncbi:MAG: ArnT family glycosyltransferase [Planctomycetota bacterium]|jgi:4-amino-4-deoxy-L-arabinose transferase-like glycosyltransferase